MKINILIAITLLIEIATGAMWLRCQKLADRFYFSNLDSQLKLDELTRNDLGYSTYIARFFHNKVLVYGSELVNKYLQFWDINFDLFFFSIVGCFGIIYGFWYLFRKEKKTFKIWLLIIALLLLPFVEIEQAPIPFAVRIILVLTPYYIFSLFGIWQFMKRHKKVGALIIGIFIFLSLWYMLVFENDIFKNFCYN
jgi:hypothetical protein